MRSVRAIWVAAALSLVVVAACGGSATTPAVTAPAPLPTAPPATTAVQPSPTAPQAIVGTWEGMHNCQRIADDLHAAGLDSQIIPNVIDAGVLPGVKSAGEIADPDDLCAGAIEIEHAHFFRASGEFGSLDQDGNQVDDGPWAIVDATTMTISGVPFHFAVSGDELRLEPIDVGDCPDPTEWCEEAWKVMVAMPGLVWARKG